MKTRIVILVLGLMLAGASALAKNPEDRFILAEGRIVIDTQTGLEWIPAPDIDATWHDAKRWAQYLAQAQGYWRMPAIEELEGLYVKGLGGHNISPLFKTSAYNVWAKQQKGESSAFFFNYNVGSRAWGWRNRSPRKRAFAVRPHKPATPK